APKTADAIYIIFDASGSMWQKLPDNSFKIEVAKKVLLNFAAGDFQGYDLAFRAYGHRRKGDCKDSQLIAPFGSPGKVAAAMKAFLKTDNPKGKTPISFSLREALKDFGGRSGEIILISDGIETCDEDPCALIREWRKKNVSINVHVVGFGLDKKSKTALKCISEAAGTKYRDANSAKELATGLSEIQKKATAPVFILKGVDKSGKTLKTDGTLSVNGSPKYRVASHIRNHVAPGKYLLTAGIKTANGNLYRPVTQTVTVKETGVTTARVTVSIPPSVKVKFTDRGKTKRGSQVTAYQKGKEVFKFRWIDEVYVDEGTYEFRANPTPENRLSLSESLGAGDHKEIVFKMVHTVHVKIKMVASGSGTWFRQNYELWQQGQKKYRVHARNGARILPGTYDLHLTDRLTPYVKPGLVVTDKAEQAFKITVPVGHVKVIYQSADGSPDKDKRCFIGRGPTGSGIYKSSGQNIPLTAGTYNVVGWRGKYDRVVFTVKEGEDQEVILRAKE
ncbi:MAG: hypothetical protein GY940_27170, partial [bacterium]|nr:hypothetical protein [bacterium]